MEPQSALDLMRPTGPARSKILQWSDFTGTGQQSANQPSIVAYYDVPLGHAAVLLADKPIRAFLKARQTDAFAADGNANRVVNIGAGNMIQSTRVAPAFPANNHPDVLAYISSDNGVTLVRATIAAVNFATGAVTVNKVAGVTNFIAVYFLSPNGELEIKAYRPVGGDTVAGRLFNRPLRGLAEVDQTNERSAMRLNIPRDTALVSQFRLALEVRSPGIISWDAFAEHDLSIQVKTAPIQINDLQRLNIETERALRGGNF
jgi:hypothetical protein